MIRPIREFVDIQYVVYALQSPCLQKQIEERSKSTAQANLFLGEIQQLVIAYPPVEEQREIVRRVGALFARSEKIEARYNTVRAQVEKLTPSLLAKAFRGELVPQVPNDEPADQLLARLRATRDSAPPAKRGRKPRQNMEHL